MLKVPQKIHAGLMVVMLMVGALWADEGRQFRIQGGETGWQKMPVRVSLEGMRPCGDGERLKLEQKRGADWVELACQVEPGAEGRLWFVPAERIQAGESATFRLSYVSKDGPSGGGVAVERNDQAYILKSGSDAIFRYYYALCDVPKGVDPVFRRSGFIHPLWSPAGSVLTRIQPPDHFHHYGIWGPWTKTHIEGREVDFWNLVKKQGTVRFGGLLATESGPVYGRVAVRQEHVMFEADGRERVAMNEELDMRAVPVELDGRKVWVIDLTSTLHNNLDSRIELAQYRYGGGVGFRATERWTNKNSDALTSAGKVRKDADATRARWCNVFGETEAGQSGILFMSHIRNREHPEPMRMWPENANGGRGDVFFEFCPIRLKNWWLEPNKTVVLNYRMVVYDGSLDGKRAEDLWQNYVHPAAAE